MSKSDPPDGDQQADDPEESVHPLKAGIDAAKDGDTESLETRLDETE